MNTRRLGPVLTSMLISLPFGVPAQAQEKVPDHANSYFVPQAGAYDAPIEGLAATRFFRACPNNDGGNVLPNNARIKVVLKDENNAPIVGVPVDRIYVHFNGGTEKQGFFGDGADSIIANGVDNPAASCPLVQHLEADAPTDATGTTYITFTGAGGAIDPNRKWGHYDSELPVVADGVQLQGRLSDEPGSTVYVLRIKNVDIKGGLQNGKDHGESVTSVDYNSFRSHIGEPPDDLTYWRDLDSDGTYGSSDFSILVQHQDHDCSHAPAP